MKIKKKRKKHLPVWTVVLLDLLLVGAAELEFSELLAAPAAAPQVDAGTPAQAAAGS